MGHKKFRARSAEDRSTAAQERYSVRHIAFPDLDPAAKDRSRRTPEGETLLGRHRNQLAARSSRAAFSPTSNSSLAPITKLPAQQRLVSQSPSLRDCCIALCRGLIGKAQTEEDHS